MAPATDIFLFQTALKKFQARLTSSEQDNFECTTLEDVQREILKIQHRQESLKSMVNMSRIQSFVEAMGQFGKVIEVFSNASPFVAYIWGPIKFILQVASTWTESFDILLEAYEKIGEAIPLLGQYRLLFEQNPDMSKFLGYVYTDILEFHQIAMRFFSGRVWRQIFRSVWKDFDTRFEGILKRLWRHKELIESQADVLHLQMYEQDRKFTIEKLESLICENDQKKRLDVLRWIAAAPTEKDHESFCSTQQAYPRSGEWILMHEKVRNWKEPGTPISSVLWLSGVPGAGKTILASVIIKDCLQIKDSMTSYFYCRYDDPEKRSCLAILKGLLSQVICQSSELLPYFFEKSCSGGNVTLNTNTLAKQLLEVCIERNAQQYIIIDGLDECEPLERKQLLCFLRTMVDSCDEYDPGKLRLLLVSQDFQDIRKELMTATNLFLTPKDNENDIKEYVNQWGARIAKKYEMDKNDIEDMETLVCARAKGMFLFAKLVMENLFRQPSREQLVKAIRENELPKDLEEAYERIMSRIKSNASPEEWDIAKKLLGWMVCAKRPLRWNEIQGAVSMNAAEQTIDFDQRKLRVHIKDICGSLIQVMPGDRLQLVHSTARAYITKTDYVSQATVECSLAALCMQYLTFECFDEEIDPRKLRELALDGHFIFQDYAISQWFLHLYTIIDFGPNRSLKDLEAKRAFTAAIQDFVSRYEDDILEPASMEAVKAGCKAFGEEEFYRSLVRLWDHVEEHLKKSSQAKNDVSIKTLADVLNRNRKLIQDLASKFPRIKEFYGEKPYKCPKLTCYYFHEGFEDAKTLKKHINQHERPFNCAVPDCSFTEFGFTSNNQLEKHTRVCHPDISQQDSVFAIQKEVKGTAKFECPICGKKFTRNFHMRNHVLSHNGERPHACPECGKAFTRANDCKRHEKIHGRR